MRIAAHGERFMRRSFSHAHRRGVNRLTARARTHKVEQAVSLPKMSLNLNCQRPITRQKFLKGINVLLNFIFFFNICPYPF